MNDAYHPYTKSLAHLGLKNHAFLMHVVMDEEIFQSSRSISLRHCPIKYQAKGTATYSTERDVPFTPMELLEGGLHSCPGIWRRTTQVAVILNTVAGD